jgi:hypothetical protein
LPAESTKHTLLASKETSIPAKYSMAVPRLMLGADQLGPHFNIVVLRDSD